MKYLILSLTLLFVIPLSFSQSYTLTTQEDIDDFSNDYQGVTEIDGILEITGNNIENLLGLASLTFIHELKIINCPNLQTLDGLNNVEAVGWWIEIKNNATLISIEALGNIVDFGEQNFDNWIWIEDNPLLESLKGIDNIMFLPITEGSGMYAISLKNNPILSYCSFENICTAIDNELLWAEVENNAGGCETVEIITLNCDLGIEGCPHDLIIQPDTNFISIGDSIFFHSSISTPTPPLYTWQSDFGQGFVDLVDYGVYSGTDLSTLTLIDAQFNNHNQKIRLLTTWGACKDTSEVSIINIVNTCIDTVLITVTDTLVINANLVGVNGQNNFNTLKVYPNPAKTHITIDYGNFIIMNDYVLTIENIEGQVVFTTPVNQQTSLIDLSTWTGVGLYFVRLYDPQNNMIENRKIVIE